MSVLYTNTIFGESAGGLSVCAQLASPTAAGLFQRAITESGPCTAQFRILPTAETAGVTRRARTYLPQGAGKVVGTVP